MAFISNEIKVQYKYLVDYIVIFDYILCPDFI